MYFIHINCLIVFCANLILIVSHESCFITSVQNSRLCNKGAKCASDARERDVAVGSDLAIFCVYGSDSLLSQTHTRFVLPPPSLHTI